MLIQILLLVLSTVCDFFTVLLLVRFALQAVRAPQLSWRNPLGQFLLAATNWMVLPCRRVIPSAFGYDSSSLLLAWLWQIVFLGVATGLSGQLIGVNASPVFAVALIGAMETIKVAIYLAMGVVLISAVFSWINPYAPMAATFNQLAQPLLRPFRRFIPPLGGVDLSPLALLLVLQILLVVLSNLRQSLTPWLYS